MWNGLRTQEALEGGVFSRRQPLSVGTVECGAKLESSMRASKPRPRLAARRGRARSLPACPNRHPPPTCTRPPCREPVPYSSKPEERDSYKGKQFGIGTSKPDAFKPLFEAGAAASAACHVGCRGAAKNPFNTCCRAACRSCQLTAGRAVH